MTSERQTSEVRCDDENRYGTWGRRRGTDQTAVKWRFPGSVAWAKREMTRGREWGSNDSRLLRPPRVWEERRGTITTGRRAVDWEREEVLSVAARK